MSGKHRPKTESEAVKTGMQVALEDMREDIGDMKRTLQKMTEAIGKLAVHEDRQSRMQADLDKLTDGVQDLAQVIIDIRNTCKNRERVIMFAEQLMAHPVVQPETYWNSKIANATEKFFLLLVGAVASGIGYKIYIVLFAAPSQPAP